MKPVFKLFGLPKSGIKPLTALLQFNGGEMLKDAFGWMHGSYQSCPQLNDINVNYLFVVRNPYTWLIACYEIFKSLVGKDPTICPHFRQNTTFDEFLRHRSYNYENPIQRWNKQNLEWYEQLQPLGGTYVRAEDLATDPLVITTTILKSADAAMASAQTPPKGIPDRATLSMPDYLDRYTAEQLAFVNEQLNIEVMRIFGYEMARTGNVDMLSPTFQGYRRLLDAVVAKEYTYPENKFEGKGIVICAGGTRYFTNAWVAVKMLRRAGCKLPIQFWYLGPQEMSSDMLQLSEQLGVECVDALEVAKRYPVRKLNGWELKPYAIIHSRFKEVMLLDSDNVAVTDPTFLFDTPQYQDTGAIFWPDFNRLEEARPIWKITGVSYRDEPEFETGQIVVDKSRCWKALQVTMHLNEHSDFYYKYIYGDKETFHMAWRKLNQEYAMPAKGIHPLTGTMCQHDFNGNRIFQHRNMLKWSFTSRKEVQDFWYEKECYEFLDELRLLWKKQLANGMSLAANRIYEDIIKQRFFQYAREGFDVRLMEFTENFNIGEGNARLEKQWAVVDRPNGPVLVIRGDEGIICELTPVGDNTYKGKWNKYEEMPITVSPPLQYDA